MTLRKRHGKAARYGIGPMVETPAAAQLGPGAQAGELADAGAERDGSGRFKPGACSAQSAGGRGRRQKLALAVRMGLGDVASLPAFEPFLRAAKAFAQAQRRQLRETVAAGQVSPAMDSVVTSAAWQKAAAEYLFAQGALGGDPEVMLRASRLADASRQNLLAAHHLAELAAKSAPRMPPPLLLDVEPYEPDKAPALAVDADADADADVRNSERPGASS